MKEDELYQKLGGRTQATVSRGFRERQQVGRHKCTQHWVFRELGGLKPRPPFYTLPYGALKFLPLFHSFITTISNTQTKVLVLGLSLQISLNVDRGEMPISLTSNAREGTGMELWAFLLHISPFLRCLSHS